jgi:tetratricopeptide (TPR) repeat protein
MIMNRCLLIWLMFITVNAFSQVNFMFDKKKADSLELVLISAAGKDRIDEMNELSFLYNRHDPFRADSLAGEALKSSQALHYLRGEAQSLYNQGILYYLDGQFNTAAEKLYASLNLYENMRDTLMMIDVNFQLASTAYFSETDKNKAMEILQTALKLATASKNNLRTAQIYASFGYIANTYSSPEGTVGKQMFEKYYHYIEGIPVNRIEKALMIASYGDSFNLTGDTRTAIDKYLLSFSLYDSEKVEERTLMSQCCSTLGNMYQLIGKPDSALFFYKYGINLSRKFYHLYGLYRSYYYLANYYNKTGEYTRALANCDSAIYYGSMSASRGSLYGDDQYDRVLGVSVEIYVPLTKGYKKYMAWSWILSTYQLSQSIYEMSGGIAEAYIALKSSTGVRDSMAEYQRNKELREIQAKYETEQKEKQILVLSQANELQELKISQNTLFLFGMGGLVILIVLLAVIILRQNKLKADHQAILLKQRLFRSQMNPHFIFNSLGSIQSSVINEEPDKAVRYLSRFSKLMRNILDSSLQEVVPLEEELATIENYLELQKVRFADKFDYNIDIDPDIDIESVFIPPMLAQPFIENAIEHGIKHKEGKGHIAIRIGRLDDWAIGRLDDWTIFEIEDDGVGREKARDLLLKQEENHKSLATVITRERIAALNRKSKKKITLEIIDLKDETGEARGTLVRFGIPVN